MQKVIVILAENESKIAFTIDGWTSIVNKSYYGITSHSLTKNGILKNFKEWNLCNRFCSIKWATYK